MPCQWRISTSKGTSRATLTTQVILAVPSAIPTRMSIGAHAHFHEFEIGTQDAIGKPRRSGAQRGVLENKLRPEVFLDAPCIFPSRTPKPLPQGSSSSWNQFFPN